jgi:Protein of unknown function (DUF1018)
MPLDNKLLRTIYAAAREHHISNDDLHASIATIGKQSLKDLDAAEACTLLDGIRGIQRHKPWAKREAMGTAGRRDRRGREDNVTHLVTPGEMQRLKEQAGLRGWSPETIAAFVLRQLGKDKIVTTADCNKVLWALKTMNRRDGLSK